MTRPPAGPGRPVTAYCAPGRRAYAALTLALAGVLDDVTAIEETPHLAGGTIIAIPEPEPFTTSARADLTPPPRRPPPLPLTTRPADPFRLDNLA